MMLVRSLVLLALACLAAPAAAQIAVPGPGGGATLVSVPSGAEVYRGDSLLGRTPLALPRDMRDTLVLFAPSRAAWRKSRAIAVPPFPTADQGVVMVRMRSWLRLSSTPSGAAVFAADSFVGYTPLDVDAALLPARFAVRKPGWRDTSLALTADEGGSVHVLLDASADAAVPDVVTDPSGLRMPSSRILLTGGIAFTAGVAAVVLKQQADRSYDDYLRTRDQSALDRTRRQDLTSGILLALTEISAGYLVYLLLNGF